MQSQSLLSPSRPLSVSHLHRLLFLVRVYFCVHVLSELSISLTTYLLRTRKDNTFFNAHSEAHFEYLANEENEDVL